MSSNPAATVRARTMPPLVISNDGASSSRDRAKFEFRETDELSPPQCPSGTTKSEQGTTATSNSSTYSDRDDRSICSMPELPSEAAARTADAGLTPRPSLTPDLLIGERVPSACARVGHPRSGSEPTRRSSLRLSLASFMARLFGPNKRAHRGRTLSKTCEDDRKESERLDRWSARQAYLPLE